MTPPQGLMGTLGGIARRANVERPDGLARVALIVGRFAVRTWRVMVDTEQRLVLAELEICDLRVRLNTALADVRRLERIVGRRTRPVLVTVESTGDVRVFGRGLDVKEAYWPQGEWRGTTRTLIEEYIDAALPDSHRGLHLPTHEKLLVSAANCPTLARLYLGLVDQKWLAALDWQRRERERTFRDPPKKQNRRRTAPRRRS